MNKFWEHIRYPWAWLRETRPEVTPVEGIYRKMFVHEGKVIRVFVIRGDKYSEVKFFIDGDPRYVVSFNTFEDLVESLEGVEEDFRKAFLSTWHEDSPKSSIDDRLKTLGYK